MAIVIAAVLAVVATAFIVTVQVEHRAATNALRGLQAEAACRAGLAAAVGRIGLCYSLEQVANSVYSVDTPGSWHEYFYSNNAGAPDYCQDLCPDTWVNHYGAGQMLGRQFDLYTVDPPEARQLKSQKGFSARYFVAVADLDGKLHCNPLYYDNLLTPAETQAMIDVLGSVSATALATDDKVKWSLGQLRSWLIVEKGLPDTEYKKNEGEKFFTVYPLVTTLDKVNMGRPAVNINTARKEVITAILSQIPSLKAAATHNASQLADYLISKRPLVNRRALEDAIYDISPVGAYIGPVTPWSTGERLSETEFNEILNSLNGTEPSIYANNARRDTGNEGGSGIYEYDFDQTDPSLQNKGGDPQPPPEASATWGTEVKFTSRFFHVYILGRTVEAATGRTMAERRLHAVYDAQTRRVLWQRWHFYPKANMADN